MAKHLLNKDTYKDFDTSQFASFASQIVDTRVILGNGKLSKELRFFDIFALATGATLSGGLFLLPGIAAAQAGPAIPLCYLIAVIPLVPALLCKVELATAMPKAPSSPLVSQSPRPPRATKLSAVYESNNRS